MYLQDQKYRTIFWEMRTYKTKAHQNATANEEIRSSRVIQPLEGCKP